MQYFTNLLDSTYVAESYLLALCESDRRKEILELLEIIDIKKLSSAESVAKIFQALGRLLLEPVAEKLLLHFKTSGMIMIFIFLSPIWILLHRTEFCLEKKKNHLHMIQPLYLLNYVTLKFQDLTPLKCRGKLYNYNH